MILLKKIQLKDFLSHKDTTLDFSENEKLLLDGASGAGKSSIFDAIIWCLYGVSRADNRSLIRKSTKMAQVTLQLKKDDNVITIKRTITSIGKHNLVVTQTQEGGFTVPFVMSGVREIQNWIEKDLIGASYLLFINSVAYVQGNADSFVMQTAAKRKELLLEIVKSEDYSKYYENARQTLSNLGNDQNMASGKIIELEAHLASLQGVISTRGEHIKSLTTNNELINEIEPKIQSLEEEKTKLLVANQNIQHLDDSLKTAIDNVAIAEKEIDQKAKKILERMKLDIMLSTAPDLKKELEIDNVSLQGLRTSMKFANTVQIKHNEVLSRKPVVHETYFKDVESLKEAIKTIQSEPICPSGTACPYSGNHPEQIKKLEDGIKKIEKIIKDEADSMVSWTKEYESLPELTDLDYIIKEMKSIEDEIKKVESQINQLELVKKDVDIIKSIEMDMPGLETALEEKKTRVIVAKRNRETAEESVDSKKITILTNELNSKKQDREVLRDNIARATAALENIDKNEEEMKLISGKISDLKKELLDIEEKIRKVELIKTAFGSKGIETLVIDYLLPRLEDKINEVLSKLSDFRVRLDTQKKSVDGDNILEGMFITIINESNEEMSFENYSGGEKLKISVAISEALATLQKVGFRLFDETFLGLDENSTESFAQVLVDLQGNFNQVLCISHLLQIKDLFDKKINIIKTKSISYAN